MMNFRETCNYNKRFRRCEHIDMPIITNDTETKGIGFEDESESQFSVQ